MSHAPIQIQDLGLFFPHKICFEGFSTSILAGSRIALFGRNGSGKSSLMKILAGLMEPTEGKIIRESDLRIAYVPQTIETMESLSGGQRFNAALTQALSQDPQILLLDEPTNHLDRTNRQSLMRMLRHYAGTLIIVSHDVELLRTVVDQFWDIDHGVVYEFSGHYNDYQREKQRKRATIENEIERLSRAKKDLHQSLMQEQERAAKSRAKGEKNIKQRKWPTIVSATKMRRNQETAGEKSAALSERKSGLIEQLEDLRLPEMILPTFSLTSADIADKMILNIRDGSVGYGDTIVMDAINITCHSHQRLAIRGDNGCGKTTLLKAILQDPQVIKAGDWLVPELKDIGYLDQHYRTLNPHASVIDNILEQVPGWTQTEARRHLNDFLFRKNEEVNALASSLSGGERARLSLAMISAKTPRLLILDEITNNLDLETRQHVIEVLQNYPGAMMVVSHDEDFLKGIGMSD